MCRCGDSFGSGGGGEGGRGEPWDKKRWENKLRSESVTIFPGRCKNTESEITVEQVATNEYLFFLDSCDEEGVAASQRTDA